MTADEEYSDEEWLTLQTGLIERLETALRDARAERDALREEMERIKVTGASRFVNDGLEIGRLRARVAELEPALDRQGHATHKERCNVIKLEARVAELERHLAAAGTALVHANERVVELEQAG